MTSIEKEKNERAKLRVESAEISSQRREDLLDLLYHAENISNGGGKSQEDIAKAVAAHMRAFVSYSLELEKRFSECAGFYGWRGILLQAKWPLAIVVSVALFSPRLPLVLDFIGKAAGLSP